MATPGRPKGGAGNRSTTTEPMEVIVGIKLTRRQAEALDRLGRHLGGLSRAATFKVVAARAMESYGFGWDEAT